MKIAIISSFLSKPLASDAIGYWSRLYYLANGLVERGHSVTVLANPKSKTRAKLIPRWIGSKPSWEIKLYTFAEFLSRHGNKFDIINAQTDHLCTPFALFLKTPILHTIIYGDFNDDVEQLLHAAKHQYFSAISRSLTQHYPYLNWQGVTYNGLNIDDFPFSEKPGKYLLYLARIVPEKGIREAIEIANRSKTKLIVAGSNKEGRFDKYVKPYLGKYVEYFGFANFKNKTRLLKNAKALIHPHLMPEGFGNSMLESQAVGTPVIAFPYGSTAEVVRDGKTGFIVKNVREAVTAVKNLDDIKRNNCRKFVRETYSTDKMVDGYLRAYKKTIKEHRKRRGN